MTEIDTVIDTIEFRLHENAAGTCFILNADNEIMFTTLDYSLALHTFETEYLTADQVEALKIHYEVMTEIENENRANRSLSCDHYSGY
jgi:hypothetical protein